jgi:hypothetical protein
MPRQTKLKAVDNVLEMSVYQWTPDKSAAALMLAEGHTYKQVGKEIGKTEKTIYRWMTDMEFSVEVDRLTLMVGIASRAERLRLAKRVIRQQDHGGVVITDKDLLDWLKYAQSETDGVKLQLTSLATALGSDDASVADSGSSGVRKTKTRT